jgi:hypothetical protein
MAVSGLGDLEELGDLANDGDGRSTPGGDGVVALGF